MSGEADAKMLRQRAAVLREIYETEKAYAKDLQDIVESYLNPMRKAKISRLTGEHVARLFSNVEDIARIHTLALDDMRMATEALGGDTHLQIGENYLSMADRMSAYNEYCKNYDAAIKLLEELQRSNTAFNKFVAKCQTSSQHPALDLGSMLIKPVQRICKYPLLFRELLKFTPEHNTDRAFLSSALGKLELVAGNVNAEKRAAENYIRMKEIHKGLSGFPGNLLHPDRVLVKEGNLFKLSPAGERQERTFFLFNDVLVWAKGKLKRNAWKFKGSVTVSELLVRSIVAPKDEEERLRGFQFVRVDAKKKTYTVFATTTAERDKWYEAIESTLVQEREREREVHVKEIQQHNDQSITLSSLVSAVNELTRKSVDDSQRIGELERIVGVLSEELDLTKERLRVERKARDALGDTVLRLMNGTTPVAAGGGASRSSGAGSGPSSRSQTLVPGSPGSSVNLGGGDGDGGGGGGGGKKAIAMRRSSKQLASLSTPFYVPSQKKPGHASPTPPPAAPAAAAPGKPESRPTSGGSDSGASAEHLSDWSPVQLAVCKGYQAKRLATGGIALRHTDLYWRPGMAGPGRMLPLIAFEVVPLPSSDSGFGLVALASQKKGGVKRGEALWVKLMDEAEASTWSRALTDAQAKAVNACASCGESMNPGGGSGKRRKGGGKMETCSRCEGSVCATCVPTSRGMDADGGQIILCQGCRRRANKAMTLVSTSKSPMAGADAAASSDESDSEDGDAVSIGDAATRERVSTAPTDEAPAPPSLPPGGAGRQKKVVRRVVRRKKGPEGESPS